MFITNKMKSSYGDTEIKVLQGLEAVRKRPGMYIGSTDEKGLHHLLWEILDNSVDEVLANACDRIKVELVDPISARISDNGRGIPLGMNKQTNLSTIDTVFTVLHAGGKFEGGSYLTSGGLHGVGASVVNALSATLQVDVCREGNHVQAIYKHGKIVTPAHQVGTSKTHGTSVFFQADREFFINCCFNRETVRHRLEQLAYLFANLHLELVQPDYAAETFHHPHGLLDYLHQLSGNKPTFIEPLTWNKGEAHLQVEVFFKYTKGDQEIIKSFANAIPTVEGGSHELGFRTGLMTAINRYARKQKHLKERDDNLEWFDLKEGLIAIINVFVPEKLLAFEGQTKNKLHVPEVKRLIELLMSDKFFTWLNHNQSQADQLMQAFLTLRNHRLESKKTKQALKQGKSSKIEKLWSGKLTPCQSKNPAETELFIVEGDSAGGSAKLGRNKQTQAILPLKGKILNVEKIKHHDILKNEEISALVYSLKTGMLPNFNLKQLAYHKVIIMTDADTDGAHIQILLLTLFYRYFYPLIGNGHLYIATPPLYQVTYGQPATKVYLYNELALRNLQAQGHKIAHIQRYKGLGEMNANQLYATTMDPNQRQLIQVQGHNLKVIDGVIVTLMGDDPQLRKAWINQHINFNE